MAAVKISWSSLFNLTELDFVPEQPKVLTMTDELRQTLSWLTGATGHDRRLLRCTDQGALLVADPWSNMAVVETDELYPQSVAADTFTASVANKGVSIATSLQLVKATITKVSGGSSGVVYVPPGWILFYPHLVYTVVVATVPGTGGTASYVGITAYN